MDLKDAAITAAILNSSNDAAAASMATLRDSNRTELETERIRSESEIASIQAETRKLEMLGEQARASDARRNIDSLKKTNHKLAQKMQQMEAEMTEMRAMMKEWVSSQRGLLALAKELKKEIDTCPNKEHHVLKDTAVVNKIAEDAADIAFADANDNGIPSKLPAYSPSWRK